MKHSTFYLLALVVFSGCGQDGFQTLNSTLNSAAQTTCIGCPPNSSPADRWKGLDTTGTVSAGPFGTQSAFEIDTLNNLLLIHLPIPGLLFGTAGISFPISQLPGATISMGQGSGNYDLTVSIPLKYLVHGIQFTTPRNLPDGRPLPGVANGELPELGIDILKYPLYLYLGKGAVGIYAPTPQFSQYLLLDLTFPIMSSDNRHILGYFAIVSKTATSSGGFFLSVALPADVQRIIDNLFP